MQVYDDRIQAESGWNKIKQKHTKHTTIYTMEQN